MSFAYRKRVSARAQKIPGESYEPAGKPPELGEGGRFEALENVLRQKGVSDPKALAAWIGRKKYGRKRMAQLAAQGKKQSR